MATKTQIQTQLEERMREFKTQMEDLTQRLEQTGEEARKELQKSLEEVKAHNERAEQQLRELKAANDDVVDTVVNDITTYWQAFTGSINEVFLKPDTTPGASSTESVDTSASKPEDESSPPTT